MYNSINLPLSFRKVWKKTIARSIGALIPFFALIIIYFSFLRSVLSTNFDNKGASIITYLGVLIFGLFIISFLGRFIYEYLYYKMYYYDFEDNGAEVRKGVISRATGHVRYDRLQNVFVDQDFWDRIFGLYDVHYETAGEKSGFYSHVDGLVKENADKLTAFLVEKSNRNNQNSQAAGIQNEPQNQNPQSSENISNNAIDNGKEISSDVYKLSPAVIFVRFLYPLLIILFAFFYIFSGKNLKGSDLGNAYLGFVEVAFAVFVFGSLIYQIIWYKNFYFHFGKDKGEIRTKVIAQSTSYVYYDRMQNINISQGVLDRLFGLYRISIETAGEKSGSSLVLYGYRGNDAQEIRNFLLEKADLFQAGRDRL